MNLYQYINNEDVCARVQSSLSLNQEKTTNCTLVVKGFHKRIHEWYQSLIDRTPNLEDKFRESTDTTTGLKTLYTKEDEATFGPFVSVPCSQYGVRFTRADIVHGTTPSAREPRRTILPWFSRINSDYIHLEKKNALT